MAVPTRDELLRELGALPIGGRTRRLFTLGRMHHADSALDGLIRTLVAGGAFERRAALTLSVAGKRPAVAHGLLGDPSASVRIPAAVAVGRYGDAASLDVKLLDSLAEDARRVVLHGIARCRPEVAERLVDPLAAARPREAAIVLVACSEPTVRRLLPVLGPHVGKWRVLVRRRPAAVLAWIESEMDATPSRAIWRTWRRFAVPLGCLTTFHGPATLAFTVRRAPVDVIPTCALHRLGTWTRNHPREVFALLMRPAYRPTLSARGLPKPIAAEARHFTDEELAALGSVLVERPAHLVALLHALAPSRRAKVFDAACKGADKRDVLWPNELLAVLPHVVRDREAKRMLEWPTVREDPSRRLDILAYRNLSEVRGELETACRTADADARGVAYRRLIEASSRHPAGMTPTLAILERTTAERDDVRAVTLSALAAVPVNRYRAEHGPDIAKLLRSAADAADCSAATAGAVGRLALRLAGPDADAALATVGLDALLRIVRRMGSSLVSLDRDKIPASTAARVAEALRPALDEFRRREKHDVALALAAGPDPDGEARRLLDPFVEAAVDSRNTAEARNAIAAWLRPRSSRVARARQLLDADPSVIDVAAVLALVCEIRDDWLEPLLGMQRVEGRFRKGDVPFAPVARRGVAGWLPRLQEAYAVRWEQLATDATRDLGARRGAVIALAASPVVTIARLRAFASSSDAPIVEAALLGLGRLGDGTGAAEELAAHLGGAHVHAAMPALRRRLLTMPPSSRDEFLHGVLEREDVKLAARKDVALLLGEFPSTRNIERVAAIGANAKTHRDLRIAAGSAARRVLPDARAWNVLERLAGAADPDEALSVLAQSPDTLGADERRRYAALMNVGAQHGDVRVRTAAFVAFPAWSPGNEEAFAATAAKRLVDMTQGRDWRSACAALIDVCIDGGAADVVLDTARKLVAAPTDRDLDATPRRDRPARQRLAELVGGLVGLHELYRRRRVALIDGLAGVLREDPTLGRLEARVRATALFWDAPDVVARCTALAADADADPTRIPEMREAIDGALDRRDAMWTPSQVLGVADTLAAPPPRSIADVFRSRSSVAGAHVALSLVVQAGRRTNWSEAAATRLRTLRAHPDRAVRAAALDVVTSVE